MKKGKIIAQTDLLQMNAVEVDGAYEIHITSTASTVIAEVGTDEVKANSLYQQLAQRFATTIESELIELRDEMESGVPDYNPLPDNSDN